MVGPMSTVETSAPPRVIDLRSDTVTRPTPGMRRAMAEADVGDDVFGEDPSVLELEAEVARLLGKAAALFVPSGTMANQLAIASQTRPGDEVIVGEGAHLAWNEAGAGAALSGVQFVTAGTGGFFSPAEMLGCVKPPVYYYPRTSLVAIENTHNRAGGKVLASGESLAVGEAARSAGLSAHLDGARIWNASVATGVDVDVLAAPFDSVSVCFSKGLGAPVGSALAGTRELVLRARRFRKMWGGGMRQAGILAAGARYALAHHRTRLEDDHANARAFAERMAAVPGVTVDLAGTTTNIVNLDLESTLAAEEVARLAKQVGVALHATGPRRLRAVTHLDVSRVDVIEGAARLSDAVARARVTVRANP